MYRYLTLTLFLAAGFVQPASSGSDNRFVIGANPDLVQGAFELRMGNYEEGIQLTLQGFRGPLDSRDREAALNNLCAGYTATGEYDKAIHICDLALSRNDRAWRTYNNRALAHLGLGNLEAAKTDVDQGLAIRPNSSKLKKAAEIIERKSRSPRLRTAEMRW